MVTWLRGNRPATTRTSATRPPRASRRSPIDRPEVRNAFRPLTVAELIRAFDVARDDPTIGVVILTGRGTRRVLQRRRPEDPRRRRLRRRARHRAAERARPADPDPSPAETGGRDGGRLRDRRRPRPARVLRPDDRGGQRAVRSDRPEAWGSFDGGYGIDLLARQVGEKRAKEVWFLCRQYDARDRARLGAGERGRPARASSRTTTVAWCREMLAFSPLALRLLKAGCERRHRRAGRRAAAGR